MEVKIQADRVVIIVSAVVGLFGFLGAIGFAAERGQTSISTSTLISCGEAMFKVGVQMHPKN
jgi:hypothetical protein